MSKIVVADLYKLALIDGKPNKEMKTLERPKVKVQESWVEKTNDNWQDTCRLYIIDEKATKEYYEKSQEINEKRKAHADLQKAASAEVLAEAVNAAIEIKEKKKPGPKSKTE